MRNFDILLGEHFNSEEVLNRATAAFAGTPSGEALLAVCIGMLCERVIQLEKKIQQLGETNEKGEGQ